MNMTTACMGSCVRRDDSWRGLAGTFWRGVFGMLALLVVQVSGVMPAAAHPHVWVTASSELIYAADGTITGVRHAWTFDEMFSTYALQGMSSFTKS